MARCEPGYARWQESARDLATGGCTFSCDGREPRTESLGGW